MQASIFFDLERKALETKEIHAHLAKLQEELSKLSQTEKSPKRFTNYFDIEKQAKSSISYELNKNKVNETLSRAGFFILIFSTPKLNSNDILKTWIPVLY